MTRHRRVSLLLSCLLAAVFPGERTLMAHDPTAPLVVEMSVRQDAQRVVVDIHFPAAALADANLPRDDDGLMARHGLDQPLAVTARALSQALEFRAGEVLLPAPVVRAAPRPDRTAVDVEFTYSLVASTGRLSARLHQFRAGGQRVRTLVRYETRDRRTRTFDLAGDYERVVFQPAVGNVASDFAMRGMNTLLATGSFLLFACCFIAPLRLARTLAVVLAAFTAGQLLSLTVVGLGVVPVSLTALAASRMVAASTIVVATVQGLFVPRSQWALALAAIFGVSLGVDNGQQFATATAFAGSHTTIALLVFAVVLGLSQAWVVTFLSAAAGFMYRWGVPERWAAVGVAAVIGHASLHRVSEYSKPVFDSPTADRVLVLLVLAWAGAILCAGIVSAILGRKGLPVAPPPWVHSGQPGQP